MVSEAHDIGFTMLNDVEGQNKMYYLDTDKINGGTVPIIILAGTSQTINTFTPHIKQIAKSRRLIIPELRCQGRTELISQHCSMHQLVADFHNFCNAIGINKMHLCGFSFGGRVALAYAAAFPDRVSRLSVTGVPHTRAPLGKVILDSWLHCAEHGNMRDCAWSFILNGYSEKFIETHHNKLSMYVDMIVQGNDRQKLIDLLRLSHAVDDRYTASSCAAKLQCPTQIIGATHDRIAGLLSVRALADAIPRSSFVEMQTGHLAPFEDPLTWRRHILDFMRV